MARRVVCSVVLAFVALVSACGGSTPTAPSPSPPVVVAPPPAPPPGPSAPNFPAISRPARVFEYHSAARPVSGYTQNSRFVVYDDGTFELQYAGIFSYPGTYSESGATIAFQFGSSVALGERRGDLLDVQFDELMQHSDFENAVYRLAR